MSSDDAFLAELQSDFLQEATDLLGKVEALSLSLERDPNNDETFAELARLAHNFKGSGKAVGFNGISSLGHKIEDYILAIKRKVLLPSSENLDFLFRCLDQLKQDVEALMLNKSDQREHTQLTDEIQARICGGVEASRLEKRCDNPMQLPSSEPESRPYTPKEIKSQPVEVLRIQKPRIDRLLESFGEQVILQSTLEQCKFDIENQKEQLIKTISLLSKLTFELQTHALSLTMVQLGPLFTKLERAARDATRICGKSIEFIFQGAETEVDKSLVDQISDSMTHMIRNSVDHGIEESSDLRQQSGKPEMGTIRVAARRVGSQLWLTITDDGKGLDPEILKNKAVSSALISREQAKQMTDQDAYMLIFKNGFSTKEQVSEVSGRGVGMNVVSEAIGSLKGSIEIESAIGKGTSFHLKLPLSLAIFNGSVVRVGESRFVIPTTDISEVARISRQDLSSVGNNKEIVKIRGEVFRVIDLGKEMRVKSQPKQALNSKGLQQVLIARKLGNVAFVVDEVLGVQKIVQKPIGDELKSRKEYAAGTILSDGSPSVIINLQALYERAS